jgi:hypothetical protein
MSTVKEAWFKKVGYEPHPQQWLFHNSLVRFRVACCGRRLQVLEKVRWPRGTLSHISLRQIRRIGL